MRRVVLAREVRPERLELPDDLVAIRRHERRAASPRLLMEAGATQRQRPAVELRDAIRGDRPVADSEMSARLLPAGKCDPHVVQRG